MGPVFIPIVLAMDSLDHRTMLEDWIRQQLVRSARFHRIVKPR